MSSHLCLVSCFQVVYVVYRQRFGPQLIIPMVLIERNILIKIFLFRLSELKSRVDELESAEKDHLEKLDDRKAEIDSLKREISRLKTVEEEVSNLLPTDMTVVVVLRRGGIGVLLQSLFVQVADSYCWCYWGCLVYTAFTTH